MLIMAAKTIVMTTSNVIVSTEISSIIQLAKNATGTVVSPSILRGTRNIKIPNKDGNKNLRNVVDLVI